jgi:hypothetical protein
LTELEEEGDGKDEEERMSHMSHAVNQVNFTAKATLTKFTVDEGVPLHFFLLALRNILLRPHRTRWLIQIY